jgi:hypothetical protein
MRRDDRPPWFGTLVGVGPASPWFEPSATWERVPVRHAAEPVVTKPPRDAWWRRIFRLIWRG